MTGTLADRLTARLDEVETVAKESPEAFITIIPPGRVLALVAATRRLIKRHRPSSWGWCDYCDHDAYSCPDLITWAAAWGVE